jgi:isopentenyl diphosphate isomerase/L-lactate dehydrogenase-like FMN-dependent dehydrogenase
VPIRSRHLDLCNADAVSELHDVLNLFDLERAALGALPALARDYYASGADDEITLRDNRAAFERLRLHYRVLVDVSQRSTATAVLGHPVALPVVIAPTAFQRLAHPDGELATARAAGAAGTAMILSTLSTTRVEDVVAAASGPVWFHATSATASRCRRAWPSRTCSPRARATCARSAPRAGSPRTSRRCWIRR